MANIYSVSLGCPKNRVDAERLLAAVPGMISVENIDDADCVIINTCAFIDPAIRESVSVIAEAIEELRAGRGATERYYSGGSHVNNEDGHTVHLEDGDPLDANFQLRKPEGVPAELADAFIRILDLAHEMKFSLSSVAFEKLFFNQTRPRLHGKTF